MTAKEFIYEDERKYSNCCTAPDMLIGDCSYSDLELCSSCGEHCIYLTSEELEREDAN